MSGSPARSGNALGNAQFAEKPRGPDRATPGRLAAIGSGYGVCYRADTRKGAQSRTSGPATMNTTTKNDHPDGSSLPAVSHPMPLHDPIMAQQWVCEAVARYAQDGARDAGRIDALVALDWEAQPIHERLLLHYVEGDAQLRTLERKYWQSALRLCQSFSRSYEARLPKIWQGTGDHWRGAASSILVRLFHHRQVEFLLRLLRYKKRNSGQWRDLNRLYELAQERDLATHSVAIGSDDGARSAVTTLERQYIRILLGELLNNGQFSPREAWWANDWLTRWCATPQLRIVHADGIDAAAQRAFVMDLDGVDGLKRAPPPGARKLLGLDPSPLMPLIAETIADLGDAEVVRDGWAPAVRDAQVALLNKLQVLYSPTPVQMKRRGERRPVALTVQAVLGLASIAQVLREEALGKEASTRIAREGDTILPYDMPSLGGLAVARGTDRGPLMPNALAFPPTRYSLQVKDHSDSGCRMRGQTNDLNRMIPGSLVAIRENESSPWTVTVVRRFRRLMIDYVEIGAEYIGRRPRFVKILTDEAREPGTDDSSKQPRGCYGALYLPPSEHNPTMRIRTLLLPARTFRPHSSVTLLSSSATYKLHLNEPIQPHLEFVWMSFTIVNKRPVASDIAEPTRIVL